jgi:hypothetical protein
MFQGLAPGAGEQLWKRLLEIVWRVEELPCPTIFASHALCLTAAFELSLACDLLLAAESAKFGLVETVVGLTPSMGGPQRLAERAGPARAKQLIYTGGLFDAATLERWNVVSRVWPDRSFAEAAHAFALRLSNGPTQAHAATKRIVRTQIEQGTRAADAIVPALSGPAGPAIKSRSNTADNANISLYLPPFGLASVIALSSGLTRQPTSEAATTGVGRRLGGVGGPGEVARSSRHASSCWMPSARVGMSVACWPSPVMPKPSVPS